MSKVFVEGIVCWSNGHDYIVMDNGSCIHCKSDNAPSVNECVNVTGTLKSITKSFNGTSVVLNYVDVYRPGTDV